jgi:hypothetical protein
MLIALPIKHPVLSSIIGLAPRKSLAIPCRRIGYMARQGPK